MRYLNDKVVKERKYKTPISPDSLHIAVSYENEIRLVNIACLKDLIIMISIYLPRKIRSRRLIVELTNKLTITH